MPGVATCGRAAAVLPGSLRIASMYALFFGMAVGKY